MRFLSLQQLFSHARLQWWLFISFVLALLPFVFSLLIFWGKLTLTQFLVRPELPFLSIVLNAGTIRDISIFPGLGQELPWGVGSAIVLIALGSALYILGRLPEIGVTVPLPLGLTGGTILLVSLLSIGVAVAVQGILAELE